MNIDNSCHELLAVIQVMGVTTTVHKIDEDDDTRVRIHAFLDEFKISRDITLDEVYYARSNMIFDSAKTVVEELKAYVLEERKRQGVTWH